MEAQVILPFESLREKMKDGGKTIHKEDSSIFAKMTEAAHNLNLKNHLVGANPSQTVEVAMPVDIEGHRGKVKTFILRFLTQLGWKSVRD